MEENTPRTSTHVSPKPKAYSMHRAKWVYGIRGTTLRKPDKAWQMRGWVKRQFDFEGATILLNPKRMEVWVQVGKHKRTDSKTLDLMLSKAWNKADTAARHFADFAQISIIEEPTTHPLGIQPFSHVVLEDKDITPLLLPYAETEGTKEMGMQKPDSSHVGRLELIGRRSVEGAKGLDWAAYELPIEWEDLKAIVGLLEAENRATASILKELVQAIREVKK